VHLVPWLLSGISVSLCPCLQVIRQEGFKALWTGYASSVLRDAPFASIYFFSYEYCKARTVEQRVLCY